MENFLMYWISTYLKKIKTGIKPVVKFKVCKY